jgi:hypothetical protein
MVGNNAPLPDETVKLVTEELIPEASTVEALFVYFATIAISY